MGTRSILRSRRSKRRGESLPAGSPGGYNPVMKSPAKSPRRGYRLTVLILLAAFGGWVFRAALAEEKAPAAAATQPAARQAAPRESAPLLGVGLRRSPYGLKSKNRDDAWWVDRAKGFAAAFPGARPMIVQVVSTYQDDGSTAFGFAKPAGYEGPTDRMTFAPGSLDPERALSAYDQAGVAAILQFEPGDADVSRCLEVTRRALGRHPCVAGYGIDLEWYRTKQSRDGTGQPVTDAEARSWTEAVRGFDRGYTFFLKHWDPKHLPPTYRHERLWFLSDSQDFAKAEELLADFKRWGAARERSTTGYQFGYPKDRKWWSKLPSPPTDLGKLIRQEVPNCGYLFWVDFTADKVSFPKPAER